MSLAAYSDGLRGLQATTAWRDTAATIARREEDRRVDPDALPPDLESEVLAAVLRARHAKQAETIAKQGWAAPGGTEYLIDDGELRAFYGEVIGKLAHSHWWSASELEARLPSQVGAGRSLPGGWAIDPVKIACLLRTADAAHLDARRAPRFMMAITRPGGHSARHWSFQNKLARPTRRDASLVYTSGASFGLEDAEAWWLCFDALCGLRKELDDVDILLEETQRPRFQVRQVA
ncbi:MAG: ATP-binding protein, partial [Alphaproteobacteria bacterium]|nr:ATP-binding protein [Alphaproteobacteria bacterium]